MRNFNNDHNSRRPQGGQRSNNQMHDAVCSDCGDNCKVPFVPSSGKPIYCSSCFENRGSGSGNSRPQGERRNDRRSDDRSPRRPSFSAPSGRPQKDYSREFAIVNDKLDKLLKALAPEEEAKKAKTKSPKKVAAKKPTPQVEVVVEEPVVESKPEVIVEAPAEVEIPKVIVEAPVEVEITEVEVAAEDTTV